VQLAARRDPMSPASSSKSASGHFGHLGGGALLPVDADIFVQIVVSMTPGWTVLSGCRLAVVRCICQPQRPCGAKRARLPRALSNSLRVRHEISAWFGG
jgi:hypothetical protein